MNYLQRLIEEVRIVFFMTLLFNNMLLLGIWYAAKQVWHLPFAIVVAILLFGGLVVNLALERLISSIVLQPLKLLWRTILDVSPSERGTTAIPRFTTLWLGKDLVEAMTGQVKRLAMMADSAEQAKAHASIDLHRNFIANSLPLPLVVLDKDNTIVFANTAALHYFETTEDNFINHNLSQRMVMAFGQAEQDFYSWQAAAKATAATAVKTWDGVHVGRGEGTDPLQFDLAAFYNKDNPDRCETVLVCFDHSATYKEKDQEVGFISLAVHELRTPITLLRGYIEALDEDLSGQLSGETKDFFNKMKVSSQQLTAFVNNILNVARIEGNQLEVRLQEENWGEIIRSTAESLQLRADVRGLQLECDIADGLPTVGVDRFSITEVINNLVDNAIKYDGGRGKKIVISAHLSKDGLVETTVTDSGVGIAKSVIPTLFNKFQRNFHNRGTISGTGIGLYLSKVIVNVHGGNIWVSSTEGQGTTVGFTVLPYASLSPDQKGTQRSDIIHSSHGWIKNHSMSRR